MLTVQQIKDTVTDYFKDKPVKEIYLYGSYARNEAREDSDVDLLIGCDESKLPYFEVLDHKLKLEKIFHNNVDLVEDCSMYPRIKKNIANEKILIYSKDAQVPINIQLLEPKTSSYGKPKRDYIVYLEIINSSIGKIFEFTKGTTDAVFIESTLLIDACMYCFTILGRNAEKVSLNIKEQFTEAEWQGLMEHKKFFDLDDIYKDWKQLWNIISNILPEVKLKIEHIIEVLEKEENGKVN